MPPSRWWRTSASAASPKVWRRPSRWRYCSRWAATMRRDTSWAIHCLNPKWWIRIAPSRPRDCVRPESVRDFDQQHVDIRSAQLAAYFVEPGEIADRPDAHAMLHIRIDGDALHGSRDTQLRQLLLPA